MPPQEIELEMEELLLRIVPGLADKWHGITSDVIAQIEQLAGGPLPSFYRWFLSRMGQSMGPLAYPTIDFSAQRVLTCYAEGLTVTEPQFLLIGYESREMMPHIFYDLAVQARADALVTYGEAQGGELYDGFETLREMLATRALLKFQIGKTPQKCKGALVSDKPDLLARIDPLMNSLGFKKPIPTGLFCGLYERPDAAMTCKASLMNKFSGIQAFTLGGSDTGSLRRILGELATGASLEVKIDDWTPALPR